MPFPSRRMAGSLPLLLRTRLAFGEGKARAKKRGDLSIRKHLWNVYC
jgi:hypothetical protein